MLCNHCSYEFPTDQDMVGKEVPCPKCGAFVNVTNTSVTLVCPACAKPFSAPVWTVGGSRTCPHCGEELLFSVGANAENSGKVVPGMLLGQYRIEKYLASGGMGDVFLATHEIMGTRCAVKVLKDTGGASFEKDAVRLIREAKLSCKIKHPNILTYFDANFSTAGRLAYIVMEYADGGSVSNLIAKGPMSVEAALPIIRSVAAALVEAGKNNVVHRDIKPDNILLTSEGEVKLADLGIAKSPVPEGAARLTVDKSILGTPNYASPEQLTNSYDVDSRSDIYSLGATFYHMLAGQIPYGDGDVMNIIAKVLDGPPEPVENLNPDIPPSVAALVRHMMAHSVDERIASASALLTEIASLDQTAPEKKEKAPSVPVKRKRKGIEDILHSLRDGSFLMPLVTFLTALLFVGGFFLLRYLSGFLPVPGDPDSPLPGLRFFPLVFWLIWLSFGFHALRLVNDAYASPGDDFGALAFGPIVVFSKLLGNALRDIFRMMGVRVPDTIQTGNVVFKNFAGQKVVSVPGTMDASAFRNQLMLRHILTSAISRSAACVMITPERGDRAAARFSYRGVCKTFLKFSSATCNSFILLLEQMAGPPDSATGSRILFAEIGERTYRFKIKTVHSETGNQATIWICLIGGTLQVLDDSGMSSSEIKQIRRILSERSGLLFVSGPPGSGKRTTTAMLLRAAKRFGSSVWIGDGSEPDFPDRYLLTPTSGRSRLDLMHLVRDRAFVAISELETNEEWESAVRMANNNQFIIVITEMEPLKIFMRAKEAGIPTAEFVSAFRAILSQRILRTLCACAKLSPVPKHLQQIWAEYALPRKGFRTETGCLDCEDTGLSGSSAAIFDIMELFPALKTELGSHLCGTRRLEICMDEAFHGIKALEHSALRLAAGGRVSAREMELVFPDMKGDMK